MHLLGMSIDDRTIVLTLANVFLDLLLIFHLPSPLVTWLRNELRIVWLRTWRRLLTPLIITLVEAIRSIIIDILVLVSFLILLPSRVRNLIGASLEVVRCSKLVLVLTAILISHILI